MQNNSDNNENKEKERLNSKGYFYTGIFTLLVIIAIIIIVGFLSLWYFSFRNF